MTDNMNLEDAVAALHKLLQEHEPVVVQWQSDKRASVTNRPDHNCAANWEGLECCVDMFRPELETVLERLQKMQAPA